MKTPRKPTTVLLLDEAGNPIGRGRLETYTQEDGSIVTAVRPVPDCEHEYHEDPTRDGMDVCIRCGQDA